MKRTLSVFLMLLALSACRRSDVRTVHIYVPGMKNAACANVIANALGREQNIPPKDIEIDMAERVVTIRYESLKRSVKNLEFTIADAGFAANGVPTTQAAVNALPPECGVAKLPEDPRTGGRNVR